MTVYQEEILARARRRFGSSNRPFPDSLPRLRSLLNLEERRLQVDHYSGLGGLEVANRRADLVDLLLDHLRGNAAARLPETEAGLLASSLAIVAVGGYGRRELSPLSDIDLAFLTPDALRETPVWLEQTIVEIVRVLFDLHLHVGAHGTFTLAEAVDLANQDLRTKTSFLESRLVAGNPQLFHQFQAQFWQACVLGRENEFLEWRQRDQTDRHNKSDNTPFLQEPHVKNGCGGLRDYQNLLWVAGVQAGARSTKDLFAQRLLADTEHRQLDRAYEFLLRVRNQMHYLQKRKGIGDILSLETQGDVAARLG